MTIQELLKENIDFNNWITSIRTDIENKSNELKELNNNLNLDEFKSLSYNEAKEIYKELRRNLNNELTNQLESILQQLKEETYPILKKAHFYPVINNIDFLTDNEKHNLDELLYKLGKGSYIHIYSSNWYNLNFDDDKTQKVLDFLYENNITEKCYRLFCECKQSSEMLTEEEYLNHKKYFEIESRINIKNITDEDDEEWFWGFNDNERLCEVGCFDGRCDGRELESWNDFQKDYAILYKMKAIADTTYSNK